MNLQVEHIAKAFGKNRVLKDVNFQMKPAFLVGIVGENGSGKSTLLRIIVGEWKPDKGNIFLSGRIGYCPQKALLFSNLTVEEHFKYFANAYGLTRPDLISRSESLIDIFNFWKIEFRRN